MGDRLGRPRRRAVRQRRTLGEPAGPFVLGSGGGASTLFAQPPYQRGVAPAGLSHANGSARPMRVIPDIAADSDFATPVLSGATERIGGRPAHYTEFPSGGAVTIALVAGMQADAQQATGTPIGFANPTIYARYGTPVYHDVTDDPLGPGVRLDAALPTGCTDASTTAWLAGPVTLISRPVRPRPGMGVTRIAGGRYRGTPSAVRAERVA